MKHLMLLAMLLLPGLAKAQVCDTLVLDLLRTMEPKTYSFSEATIGLSVLAQPLAPHQDCDRPGCLVEHLEVPLPGSSAPADTVCWPTLEALLACLVAEWKQQTPTAPEP